MKKIILEWINHDLIKQLLNQYWWAVKINFNSTIYNWITYKLIEELKEKFKTNVPTFSIFEIYTLSRIINFSLLNLGINEFSLVTSYDLQDWYKLLENLNNYID